MGRVLVTGGAGFLGSHVADHLLTAGHRVVVLDDFSGGFRRNVPREAELHEGSILDEQLVDGLFRRHRFDHVFHLAAHAAEALSHFVRRFNYSNNVIGSVNLINAAVRHGTGSFVFTSSIGVYGAAPVPHDETMAPAPADPYGIAKLAVELDLRAARRMFGLRYVIFRAHNLYGERQNLADPYRNVVGIFVRQVREGRPCTIFGDGSQTRAFTHVDDVAPLIARSIDVAQAADGIFNIGANSTCSVRELAEKVQRAVGRHVGIEYLPPREEGLHAHADHSRLQRVFGAREAIGLDAGLARMAAWAHSLEALRPSRRGAVELQRGLPGAWTPDP